jgi:hypothetical protein
MIPDNDLAGLPQIESVEGLVHEEDRLWRQKRKRQHEPPAISF